MFAFLFLKHIYVLWHDFDFHTSLLWQFAVFDIDSRLQTCLNEFKILMSFCITSNMEEDRLFDERISIRESARPLKKYGSTCNHMKRNEEYIKHVMAKGDTLQGIALKYGVTVSAMEFTKHLK